MSMTNSNFVGEFPHTLLWCNGSTGGSNPLGQGSNPWGRTNVKTVNEMFPNEKNRLIHMCEMSIKMINELMRQIEKEELQNEQFVINWLDKLNEISVKY